MSFALWGGLDEIGRDERTGGYHRFSWGPADLASRAWFEEEARRRGLGVEPDRNGNLWAWWGEPGSSALGIGSHLDTVPDGGAYDGALGVVSALGAIDELRSRGVSPSRPIAVIAFTEEEGARFGVACLGSRLMTGSIDPRRAAGLTDADGVTLVEAMQAAGWEAARLGRDDPSLARLSAFVELHVEQGVGLAEEGAAVGVASAIWPHGRWRFRLDGEANHAGTTKMPDRHDPMLTLARLIGAARAEAVGCCGVATVGKVLVEPNGSNAIPSSVDAWLDARAPDEATLRALVASVGKQMGGGEPGGAVARSMTEESFSSSVRFDSSLRDRIRRVLGDVPVHGTAAGHDAGILAPHVPTAMVFVRNPDGVSHSPHEHIDDDDCLAGVDALARVVSDLAC